MPNLPFCSILVSLKKSCGSDPAICNRVRSCVLAFRAMWAAEACSLTAASVMGLARSSSSTPPSSRLTTPSRVYTKESSDPEYSGYGIELTFKLKKSTNDEEEIKNGCGLLQYVARYIFKTGKVVLPEEYIYTKQTVGIDAQQKSKLKIGRAHV